MSIYARASFWSGVFDRAGGAEVLPPSCSRKG
nr:MAG TPA: hypothetical protein [Caudoviricetes sp.]